MRWYYIGYGVMGYVPELGKYIQFATYEEYLEYYNSR